MATADADTSDDPSLAALAKVVLYKKFILLVRYPVNTGAQFLTMIIFFALIFFGGRAVAGAALTRSLEGIIVGFFLFTLSTIAYSGLAWSVTREAQWGTLERLYMSPHGFGTVMVVKTVVNVFMSLLWSGTLLVIMMAMTGRWLIIDPLTVLPLVGLTLLAVLGIGFLFGGLALVYKRIESIFQLVQFGFIALIAAPVDRLAYLKLLPISQGSYLLRTAMRDGTRLWEFPAGELAILVATSVVYLSAGYYCFYRASVRARSEGLLGHY
ncbi:ABC transporter permease [Halorussus lipolyticus]|uniref:ABC transporter permease n=1 Tax=Halorussus lipolyticus TaxID=3034024 RepID=UPI0023E75D7C|nr:ABC transporter permease [Halorussus sp. DT80]